MLSVLFKFHIHKTLNNVSAPSSRTESQISCSNVLYKQKSRLKVLKAQWTVINIPKPHVMLARSLTNFNN